ncbi:hypothetical protein ACFRMO_02870 [Streptomyces anulatus]|nr:MULTISPECIES: hypothetical protein [unclassified Streptomyces]KQX27638.1 hypothetical protein ASD29_30685 [Streptomyces sp. Root1295]KRA45006.1 hypothetical protein ASD97_39845 [Streptomyces sp. Root63]
MDQLIGVIALGGGALTAWLTAMHQKDAARAKDLRDRRAAVCFDLLLHLSGAVSFATDPVVPGYYGPRPPEQYQLRRDLAARVAPHRLPESPGTLGGRHRGHRRSALPLR